MNFITRISLCVLIFTAIIGIPVVTATEHEEYLEINQKLEIIEVAINNGDADVIINMMSDNVTPVLRDRTRETFTDDSLTYEHTIKSFEVVGEDTVKVKGRFKASAANWSVNFMTVYYTFEKVNGEWMLLDTNIHDQIEGGAFRVIAIVGFIILAVLSVLGGAFWIWMLIDAATRTFDTRDNKIVWLLVIILVGFIGALIYFFVIKIRKEVSRMQDMPENQTTGGEINPSPVDGAAVTGAPQAEGQLNSVSTSTGIESEKSRIVALLLCFFLGSFGVHRFYVGKIGTGIVWLLTLGIFGIGSLIDLVLIIVGAFTDKEGKKVTRWE